MSSFDYSIATGKFSGRDRLGNLEDQVSAISTVITRSSQPTSRGLARILELMAPADPTVAVGLMPNGTDYYFTLGWGGGRHWQCILAQETANPGSYALRQLQKQAEAFPMLSLVGSDVSVVRNGVWTGPTASTGSYGGQYWFATAAASNVTITTPANVTRIGLRYLSANNGGLARVSIDSDFTKANLLPTALDVINSGAYPNTILIANGGTCNPYDRVLDCYSTNTVSDNLVAIADENALEAKVHTVVLTPVAVARSVGGGTRLYNSGFSYARATDDLTTANTVPHTAVLLNAGQSSAWEYAIQATFPVAGATFFGSVHGYEVEDSLTVTVDGAATTLTAGTISVGVSTVAITRVSHLVSPDDASTLATVTVVYTMDSNGLKTDTTITWKKTLSITAAYVMMPLNGLQWKESGNSSLGDVAFNQGNMLNFPLGPATLGSAGDTYVGNAKSEAAWMWGGNYAALIWQPDVNTWTQNWANSTQYTSLESRAIGNPLVTKVYIGRIWTGTGRSEAVSNGTVWTASTRYLLARIPGGAAPVLYGA